VRARRVEAVEAAVGLEQRLGLAERRRDLAEVALDLLDRQ
jgi:hypothetical protein